MFDWFKNKSSYTNVVEFPKPTIVPPMPKVEEPKQPSITVYSIGPTENGRLSFTVGYNSFTMNRLGCENLIKTLTLALEQLPDTE